MPRLVRLSHRQYDNTVRDLLQLAPEAEPSSQFLEDPPVAGFDNNASALVVKDRLGRDYRRAAESLAEQVTAPAKLATLLPCQPEGDGSACASQFIAQFGRRVFRRALTASDLTTSAASTHRARAYDAAAASSRACASSSSDAAVAALPLQHRASDTIGRREVP